MPFYVTILVVMDSNFLKFKGLEQGFEIFAHWQHIHRSDVEQQMEIVYCFVKFVKCKLLQILQLNKSFIVSNNIVLLAHNHGSN
ncbi:hypothetical protein HUJ04_007534 [Dendroctonus ponderosae]|nr:hypothetical protein HUJ04_007534 [Dendroctonus ponderosae]